MLFLISDDNTTARYFVLVALIFLVSMSMLLIIFVPLFIQIRRAKAQVEQDVQGTLRQSHVSWSNDSSRTWQSHEKQIGAWSRSTSLLTFNSVLKVPHPDTQQDSDGQGQESTTDSTDAAAAMPV